MNTITTIFQIIIALGIFNVWFLRAKKATAWRGGNATSMREEFAAYGLPNWFMGLIGFAKVTLAICLLAGLLVPALTQPAAIGMAVLMLGAVSMHVKVKDPLKKSLPAFCMLVLSLIVAVS